MSAASLRKLIQCANRALVRQGTKALLIEGVTPRERAQVQALRETHSLLEALIAALSTTSPAEAIDMVLHCPSCGEQHIVMGRDREITLDRSIT